MRLSETQRDGRLPDGGGNSSSVIPDIVQLWTRNCIVGIPFCLLSRQLRVTVVLLGILGQAVLPPSAGIMDWLLNYRTAVVPVLVLMLASTGVLVSSNTRLVPEVEVPAGTVLELRLWSC